MKRNVSIGILSTLILAGLMTIAQTRSSTTRLQQKQIAQDTIPQKRETRIKDFDEAMQELDKAMLELNKELKKPILPIPPIEVEKIKAELDVALKDVDPEKIKAEVELAMKQIDAEKIRAQVQASLAKVDMEKVRKEIERIKEIELPKIEEEMKKMGPQIEKAMAEAKVSVEKAKKELQEYKNFETSLEKDGLINKMEYTIEHKKGVFSINGQQQPEAVYNKYRTFLEKHKDFTLKKDKDGLDIHNEKE